MDRLTDEEARMTAAHTLEVVHGLVNNLKVVIDGVQIALRWLSIIVLTGWNRRQGVIGGHTTGFKYVLRGFVEVSLSDYKFQLRCKRWRMI